MCGIAGYSRAGISAEPDRLLQTMGQAILHRGPDASGVYVDDRMAMVHRRLSIIDLSEQGNQPMLSQDGRYIIVYNGEIYNFLELRRELKKTGVVFRTGTDTEVLLELYAREGERCLGKLNGMFAFAIWDKREQTLFLARDRIGKKPLYYYTDSKGRFAFASEIKCILAIPDLSQQLDPTALCDFLKYHYVPAPKTIYQDIFKLPPGCCMVVSNDLKVTITEYWDVHFTERNSDSSGSPVDELLELLHDSTKLRMIADVPLGAFLSGGIDSSAVVALMADAEQGRVRTCTIGFDDKHHDESIYARTVADLYNTDHHEYRVTEDIPSTVKTLPQFFDEPFADSSAVPTYHVSRLARQAVTVALAGDGGDENFAGYAKYAVELKEDMVRQYMPDALLHMINKACGESHHPLIRKARSLTGSALLEPARACYRSNTFINDTVLQNLLAEDVRKKTAGYDPAEHILRHWQRMQGSDYVSCMLYTDLKTYLPDDILVKVDRMSMAHSLEVRAPFLDYRIIEFAAGLPSRSKIKGNQQKVLLKKAFEQFLPKRILNRKKHGFSVPLDSWFRGELKAMTEDALMNSDLIHQYLNVTYIEKMWQAHQSGKIQHGSTLWSLLMFALWQQEYQGA